METERHLPAHRELKVPEGSKGTRVINNVVGLSAVNMAATVRAKCITVPTTTGRSARLVSHFRPNMPIVAFTRNEWAVPKMLMYWGVVPFHVSTEGDDVSLTAARAIEAARDRGYLEKGDITVVTAGDPTTSVTLEDKVTSTNVVCVAQVR